MIEGIKRIYLLYLNSEWADVNHCLFVVFICMFV